MSMSPDELREAIKAAENGSVELRRLMRIIDSGSGDYATATMMSEAIGSILSGNFTKAISGLEMISEAEAAAMFAPRLRDAYRLIGRESSIVQKALNRRAGLSINGLMPDVDESRIANWVQKIASDVLEKTGFLTGEDVLQNFARSAVTKTIEENAQFHSEAGLLSYIERDPGSGCCEWCSSMAGRYVYGKQPDDFFRVHKDCTCSITYMPAKGKWQRNTYRTNDEGKMSRIVETVG